MPRSPSRHVGLTLKNFPSPRHRTSPGDNNTSDVMSCSRLPRRTRRCDEGTERRVPHELVKFISLLHVKLQRISQQVTRVTICSDPSFKNTLASIPTHRGVESYDGKSRATIAGILDQHWCHLDLVRLNTNGICYMMTYTSRE